MLAGKESTAARRSPDGELRTLIDTLPILAWTAAPDGTADFFSRGWIDYVGRSQEQLLGVAWTGALHPDDRDRVVAYWMRHVPTKQHGEIEARLQRFDGVYRWFLLRAAPLLDEAGEVVKWYGTNTDIEDQKRAEDELRRSKAYLEHAQKLSRTGSVGFRLVDGQVSWSAETARIYGYDPAIPPTLEMVLARVHPEDVEPLRSMVAHAARGGAAFDFEHRLLMPDGSIKHVRCLARTVRDELGSEEVLGAVTDITEQYNARRALEEALARAQASEAELRTTVDAIPTQVWSALPDGSAEFQNRTWREYTGMGADAMRGRGWHVVIHPDDLAAYAGWWEQIWRTHVPGEAEARFRRADGVYRWFLSRAIALRDEEGRVLRWYGTNTDIEELKRAEDAARVSEDVARGQVQALVQSLDVFATAPAPDQFIAQMLSTIGRLMDGQWVALWLLDRARDSLLLRASVYCSKADPADQDHPFVKDPLAWKQDVSLHELFVSGAPVVCEDVDADTRISDALRTYFKKHGTRKFLRLPTLVGGEVKGFITIRHGQRDPYRTSEIELAQALAHQAMLALQIEQAATAEERNRMARDIHDTLAQGFTAVIIQLQAAEDAKKRGLAAELEQHLKSARELARSSLNEARRSVQALRAQALENATLWDALKALITSTTAGTKLQGSFRMDGAAWHLPPLQQEQLLQIGREALTNTLRHAEATHFNTRLSFSGDEVRLEFEDDGCGFAVAARHNGYGLTGMRERAAKIGWSIEIGSLAGAGTKISLLSARNATS